MIKGITLLVAAMTLSAQAFAAAPAAPKKADPAAGKRLTTACAACHGSDGNSPSPAFPKLAGQNAKYTLKQLQDIKSGERPIAVMMGQLDNMDEQDLRNIAAYYAEQTSTIGQADPAKVELGEQIWRAGIAERKIPACAACHGPRGEGMVGTTFPKLSGQYADYTVSQLKAFRAAQDGDDSGRANDGDELRTMRMISFRLSDAEMEAVASYAEGLH